MTAQPALVITVGTESMDWCDTCQHGSVIVADLVCLGAEGVSTVGRLRRCLECNPFEDEEDA